MLQLVSVSPRAAFALPNGHAVQLRPTAPTTSATAPAARTVPRIDRNELLGVSCNRVLDGALSLEVFIDDGFKAATDWPRARREILQPKR